MSPSVVDTFPTRGLVSGEEYPNRFASFGLNRAYMKIRTSNSPYTDNTLLLGHFYGFCDV